MFLEYILFYIHKMFSLCNFLRNSVELGLLSAPFTVINVSFPLLAWRGGDTTPNK